MFRIQVKLFLRSPVRVFLLAVLFAGSLYYYAPAALAYMQNGTYYLGLGMLQKQLRDFIYIFLILLFLSFDYFRETQDAKLSEMLKVNQSYWRQDVMQAFVMMLVVLAYAVCFLIIHIGCHVLEDACTLQVVLYYLRIIGVYYILNGVVALMAGWIFARISNKIIGYIGIISFGFLISPLMSSELESYSYHIRWLPHVIKCILLMPQGTLSMDEFSLSAANWSIATRGIFWIATMGTILTLYYSQRQMKGHNIWKRVLIIAEAGCAIGAFIYSSLPASYYCINNFVDEYDDQWRYIIENVEQKEREADFRILSYDMKLYMGRQMRAKVTCVPSEKTLQEYAITLYRLYQIDSITDENGDKLNYQRDENTLLIYGQKDGIETFTIQYHGGPTGNANMYNNRFATYLPGWFPYYPIPGWHKIYGMDSEGNEQSYISNRLDIPADFSIQVYASGQVYSDLDFNNIKGKQFGGISKGPTILAGFISDMKLENGSIFIYPSFAIPDVNAIREEQTYIQNVIEEQGNKIKLIMWTPGISEGAPGIYEEDRIIDSVTLDVLARTYKETGQFDWQKIIIPVTEEDRISTVKAVYYNMKETYEGKMLFDCVKDVYLTHMQEFGYTEDGFEEFIIKNLGQEEWDYLKEAQEDAEN